ncbi:MAG: D-alanine--D-alanine ligase [Armatimonadetes bacterium]|nr:D-alanine--D-alanine ligase [Armatimonadota bacterium]
MARLRVAVLMGGRSAEREVSLATGRQVMAALDPEKYEAFWIDPAHLGSASAGAIACGEPVPEDAFKVLPTPVQALLDPEKRPDVVFICLHGRYGEDGTIQGMLELLGIPYVGSGVLGSAVAVNKVVSKCLFAAHGIPTPAWTAVRGRAEADAFLAEWRAGRSHVRVPVIVKPAEEGSTIGVTVVKEEEAMPAALDTALHYGEEVLIEAFLGGATELTVPVLGNEVLETLPIVEIIPQGGFYDYERKYTPGATEEIVPARIPTRHAERARALAMRTHRALHCRGMSRVDMLLANDEIWVLEANTIPGMTPTSLLPRAAQAGGLPFPRLLDRLIKLALEGHSLASAARASAEGPTAP